MRSVQVTAGQPCTLNAPVITARSNGSRSLTGTAVANATVTIYKINSDGTFTQAASDLTSGTNYPFSNTIYNKNKSYYTAFAIDYPEGSFGGDAANRQGITPGLNVRSGGKTYDASRALHLWVWDEAGGAWVADSFFGGLRLNGHCYDNYSGSGVTTTELALFVSNYNTIKSSYPKATYIVMGSHRADTYNSQTQRQRRNPHSSPAPRLFQQTPASGVLE